MAVLYRKYRPKNFSEMVGQDSVVDALKRSISSGNSPHALLFVGPKGSGKTTAARIFAKALNCPNVTNGDPCGKCEICVEIASGASVDVMEIDGASNRKIDDVREIRDKISLSPSRLTKKVYIIDEVHMLTKEAFNALLKTLEEPPVHAVFVLCTTEPEKLPATIISRCQRFDFNLGVEAEIKEFLEKILLMEKVTFEEEAIGMIAQYAGGSFRDALSMAGQVAVFENITLSIVEETLSKGRNKDAKDFVQAILENDGEKAINIITKLSQKGFDATEFVRGSLLFVKDLLFEKMSASSTGAGYAKDDLINIYNSLDKCFQRVKYSPVTELPLILVVAELTDSAEPKSKKLDKEEKGKKEGEPSEFLEKKVAEQDSKKTKEDDKLTADVLPEKDEIKNEVEIISDHKSSDQLQTIYNNWKAILENLRSKNIYATTILRGSKPTAFDGSKVTIEVYFRLHQDKLKEVKTLKLVESAMSTILGKKVYLLINVGKKEITPTSDLSVENLVEAAGEIFGTSN